MRVAGLHAFGSSLLLCYVVLNAATIDTSFPGFVDQPVVSQLSNPTAMAFAPDGRLFVCQQAGALRVIQNGALLQTPFVTVTTDSTGERGLLGIDFDPAFAQNQYVYVYYTVPANAVAGRTKPFNRISRFTANSNVAVSGSEQVILDLNDLNATNHNGGAIHFGIDGKLYAAAGENAVTANAQSFNNALGKILRINPDGTIPADNPFLAQTTGIQRSIWAMGLRNPFTFAIQPGTGRMHINDVGASSREEINLGAAGANYGWPATEGTFNPSTFPQYTNPIYAYPHFSDDRGGCAISGGDFYNPSTPTFPSLWLGRYFFADLCTGWIRYLDAAGSSQVFARGIANPVDIRTGPDGALYYLARGSGEVRRIQYGAPVIQQQPQGANVVAGQSVTFTVTANGLPVLRYAWRRNGQPIPGATSASYTIASTAAGDNGAQFDVEVSNDYGAVASNAVTLVVSTPPQGPAAPVLLAPAEGATLSSSSVSLTWTGGEGATSFDVYFGGSVQAPFVANTAGFLYSPPQALASSASYYWRIVAKNANGSASSPVRSFQTSAPPVALRFVAVTPCRLVDTRASEQVPAPFGPPALTVAGVRTFPIPAGRCGIPANARAYSLNVTVVPKGPLSFLTLWPSGHTQPMVSTLNSFDGRVLANAAIVPAGTNGAIDVFATNSTELILDINGYFVPMP